MVAPSILITIYIVKLCTGVPGGVPLKMSVWLSLHEQILTI